MVVFELLSFASALATARVLDDDSSDLDKEVAKLDSVADRLNRTEVSLSDTATKEESLLDRLETLIEDLSPSSSILGALATQTDTYPGYAGSLKITGSVYVLEADNGALEIKYNLKGLETSTTGGIHIHAGTSCYDAALPGGHYWAPTSDIKADPWPTGSMWTSDAKGDGVGVIKIKSGYPKLQDNTGHVIVVHQADDTRAACGVLSPMNTLGTEAFVPYPGYTGPQMSISGTVVVSTLKAESGDDVLHLSYNLENLEASTSGGFHIHQGTDCTSDAAGHFYNPSTMAGDPWGANMWTSDASGNGYGEMDFDSGFPNLATNDGHVIVVHTSDGAKAACAKLNNLGTISTTELAKLSTYTGKYMITGEVGATMTPDGKAELTWELAGLETDIYGGIHIHAGKTCDDVGGHYYDSAYTKGKDVWTSSMWVSNGDGVSVGSSEIDSGEYALSQNFHHAIVVHTHNGDKAACSEMTMPMNALTVSDKDISGDVAVWQDATGKLNVEWDLEGMSASAGTLAVGSATSCDFNSMSAGDLYAYQDADGTTMDTLPDPWDAAKWTAEDGKTKGTFAADIGVHGLENIQGHVLLLKDAAGSAVSCAQLIPMAHKGDTADGDMTTAAPSNGGGGSDGPAPDMDALTANNALVSTQTCSIMEEGFPNLYGKAEVFTMTVNACSNVASIHTPTITKKGMEVTVNVNHPAQQPDHYIQWLFFTGSDGTPAMWHNFAQPTEEMPTPVNTTFTISSSMVGEKVTPYSYCNLHGLWMGDSITL